MRPEAGGDPEEVRVHDFLIKELGRAVPYGVYDLAANEGWVSVGIDRLFSFISMNWRAKPLVSYRVIVDLISATTTDAGLKVRCELDKKFYPKGIVVSDQEMAKIKRLWCKFLV